MSKISQESIEQVAAANDIVDVIGSYFPLKRAGTSFRALCPFHNEKSPSFHVNPARQSFHCFGCGAGGGVFRFVMDYEHLDFPTAVRRLAERVGITLQEESSAQDTVLRNERSRLLDLHRKAALWYHHQLLRSPAAAPARDYLKARGFSKEIAIAWQLGYAPAAWDASKAWGESEGFSRSDLVLGGLLLERGSRDVYDRFRHRLMFPIRNDYGDVIGFSGRTLSNDAQEAKYLNSPETPIFSKGRVLFGIDKSKRALIQAGEAIVMEGQIDLIAAFEHGCQNVVAPQGTAFTGEQARLLRRFVERIILCFDSDTAGKNAVERSLPALLASGFDVRVANLPAGEDPDSVIRKQGVEAFQQVLAEAEDFFDHAMARARADAGGRFTPHETTALAKKLAGYLILLPDATLREITTSKVAAQLGVSVLALKEATPKAMPLLEERSETIVRSPLKISAGTELLCRLTLCHSEVRDWLRAQTAPEPHELDPELSLLEELLSIEFAPAESSMATLLPQLSPDLQRVVSSWNLEKKLPDPLGTAKDVWAGLQIIYWKRRQAGVTARLKKSDIQPQEIIELQKEILDLQRRIYDLSAVIPGHSSRVH